MTFAYAKCIYNSKNANHIFSRALDTCVGYKWELIDSDEAWKKKTERANTIAWNNK